MTTSSLCCTICSETYKSTDEILATKCGHVCHNSCFQDWQSRSPTCPECRAENPQTQRIYLHIEDPTDVERKAMEEKIELVNRVSLLERQIEENEQNFLDIQQALSVSEEQVNELNQQIELKNALNASYEQELMKFKQALEESEKNFMNTLEQLKKVENEMNNRAMEIDFLKLQNEGREKKIAELRAEHAVSIKQNQELHLMFQNKLEISHDQIKKLNQDMNKLKIENESQQREMDSENKEPEYEEKIKRLELKLKQMSLELDKEIQLSMNLTVENMKLKSIIALPLQSSEDKQKLAVECDEQRKRNTVNCSGICNDLIDLNIG